MPYKMCMGMGMGGIVTSLHWNV